MCMQQFMNKCSYYNNKYDKHAHNKFIADHIKIKQQQHSPILTSFDWGTLVDVCVGVTIWLGLYADEFWL